MKDPEKIREKYSKNKWTRIYAKAIDYERQLKDAELRLFHIYLRIVGWDPKHTETFGSSDITQRDLLYLLPDKKSGEKNWSVAKVNSVIKSLIDKGWIERRPDGRIAVINYVVYRLVGKDSARLAEQGIRWTRQGVRLEKPTVQPPEKSESDKMRELNEFKRELSNKMGFRVQLNERPPILKTPKDIKNN